MQLGNGIRSILKNGAYLFGSNIWTALVRAIYLVFLTRFLGPEDYGVWAYAIATYILTMTAAGLGLDLLFSVRIGLRKHRAPRFFAAGFTLRIGFLALFTLFIVALAFLAEDAGIIRNAILLSIPALWGRSLAVWSRAILLGMERTDIAFRADLVLRSVEVAAGIALLYAGAGVLTLLILHGLTWLVQAALLLRRLRVLGLRPALGWDRRMLVRVLVAGGALGAAVLLNTFLSSGPIIMARRLTADLAELGQIAVVFQMAGLLGGLALPFLNAALPILSRSARAGDVRVRRFGPLVAVASLVTAVIGAGVAQLIGADLIHLLFGPRFDMAGEMLAPAVIVAGLMTAPVGFNHYLVVMGRRAETAVANGAGALCLLVAAGPMLDAFGSVGILGAAALGWLVRLVLLVVLAVRAAPAD